MVIKNVTSPFLILSSSAHLLSFEYTHHRDRVSWNDSIKWQDLDYELEINKFLNLSNQENKSDKLSSHFVFSKAFATNFRSLNCFSSEFIIVTLNSRYLLF